MVIFQFVMLVYQRVKLRWFGAMKKNFVDPNTVPDPSLRTVTGFFGLRSTKKDLVPFHRNPTIIISVGKMMIFQWNFVYPILRLKPESLWFNIPQLELAGMLQCDHQCPCQDPPEKLVALTRDSMRAECKWYSSTDQSLCWQAARGLTA